MSFPTINASLNALCTVLLLCGLFAIKRHRIPLHKTFMLSALSVSVIFLACYLYYHIVVRHGEPTRFTGTGFIRPVYFALLLSHTILAALSAPLAIWTARLGLSGNFIRHKKIAKITFPIWLYVSVTGVVVYWMLYHLYPPG